MEKVPFQEYNAARDAQTRRSRFRRRLIFFVIGAFVFFNVYRYRYSPRWTTRPASKSMASDKVFLEAHIMSKCPDARDCLHDLVLPTMQNVSDKVEFTLSFIGKTNDKDEGVACMHGPEECLGNILMLCAADRYPDPKIYLGYAMCMMADDKYRQIPDQTLVQNCALEHGINPDALNDCASQDDGAYAMHLLHKSVERTKNVGVAKSCTVRLNDDIRCVLDGGKWYQCPGGHDPADLISDINTLYRPATGSI